MNKKLLTLVALAMMVGSTAFARSRFSIGVNIGPSYGYGYAYAPYPAYSYPVAPYAYDGYGYAYGSPYGYVVAPPPVTYVQPRVYVRAPEYRRGYSRYVAPRVERGRSRGYRR